MSGVFGPRRVLWAIHSKYGRNHQTTYSITITITSLKTIENLYNIIQKANDILPMRVSILKYSKDYLYMSKDNVIRFLPIDSFCATESSTGLLKQRKLPIN